MNDRDIDTAYAESEAQEDLRWINNAIPHVVTITADLFDVLQAYRHFRRPGA